MGNADVTGLLAELGAGHPSAAERLLPLVYDELRGLARGMMRGGAAAGTLQPTALVNEACIRLLGVHDPGWNGRAHFFAVAATAMRQILASHARAKRASKRSAPGHRVTLSGTPGVERDVDLLALDDALSQLAALNPRHARLVELRFFGGLTMEEAAQLMGVSVSSAHRDWRAARAWLGARLGEAAAGGEA